MAKTGSGALTRTLSEIEKYKERNHKYPVTLDNIQKGFAAEAEKELKAACPECGDLGYHTDSYGFELIYRYSHMGPNWCTYSTDTEKWNCRGNY